MNSESMADEEPSEGLALDEEAEAVDGVCRCCCRKVASTSLHSLSCVFLAFLFLTIWSLGPPVREQTPAPVQTSLPQSISHEAFDLADAFLKNLQQEQFDQAWLSLSRELQSRWAPEDFKRQLASWVAEGDNKEILAARQISKVQRHNRTAQVFIYESSVTGDRERWSWEISEQDGTWSVTKIDGPVKGP